MAQGAHKGPAPLWSQTRPQRSQWVPEVQVLHKASACREHKQINKEYVFRSWAALLSADEDAQEKMVQECRKCRAPRRRHQAHQTIREAALQNALPQGQKERGLLEEQAECGCPFRRQQDCMYHKAANVVTRRICDTLCMWTKPRLRCCGIPCIHYITSRPLSLWKNIRCSRRAPPALSPLHDGMPLRCLSLSRMFPCGTCAHAS